MIMKRYLFILITIIFILTLSNSVIAQSSTSVASRLRAGTSLPATCQPTGRNVFYKSDSGELYTCTATNTWTVVSGGGGGGANTALSNLAAVAINTTLVSDTDNTDDLGTSSVGWRTAYVDTSVVSPLFTNGAALSITTTAGNGNITLTPNGTGQVVVSANQLKIPASHPNGISYDATTLIYGGSNTVTFYLNSANVVRARTEGVAVGSTGQFQFTSTDASASGDSGWGRSGAGLVAPTDGSTGLGGIGDRNGNELLKFAQTASAVNEFTITNAATGNAPSITATGGDTNINFSIAQKGSANVRIGVGSNIVGIGDVDQNIARISANGIDGIYFSVFNANQRIQMRNDTLIIGGVGVFQAANDVLAFTDGSNGSTAGGTFAAIATSPSQIGADQNNYNPGGSSYFQRWSSDASRNVTGLTFTAAQVAGQTHTICNVGSQNIVLVHDDGSSSTAANRFKFTGGSNVTIAADACVILTYDATTSRWRRAQ